MGSILQNMTLAEYLKSYLHLLDSPLRYIRTYKNGLSVILHLLQNKFPFKGVLKNGEKISIHNYYEAYLASFNILHGYKIEGDLISLSTKDFPDVKLHLENNNGDVHGVFFEQVYDFLKVKDKIVLDIGANIGDSSIYFALKGAKKIIALEPFPKNNNTAKKNIELNHLSDKITLLSAGCSAKKGEISLDPNQEGAGSATDFVTDGVKIPLKTLEELIHEFKIPDDSIMKVDCEGCEIEVILSSDKKILGKFSQIEIEYHYGYKDLKNKLENCGFKVVTSPPLFLRNKQSNKSMYFGYLYATNISKI
jgi:FkbM family methyltransferase